MRSILTIDKVLVKERWHKVLVEGRQRRWGRSAAFPPLPVDYGFEQCPFLVHEAQSALPRADPEKQATFVVFGDVGHHPRRLC